MKFIRNRKVRIILLLVLCVVAYVLVNLKITSELVQTKVESITPSSFGSINVTLVGTEGGGNNKKYHVKIHNKRVQTQVSVGSSMVVKRTTYGLFGKRIQRDKFNVVKIKMSPDMKPPAGAKEYKVLAEIKSADIQPAYKIEGKVNVDLVVDLQDKVGGTTNVMFDVYGQDIEKIRRKYAVGGLITLKKSVETDENGNVKYLRYDYQEWGYDGLEYEPEK